MRALLSSARLTVLLLVVALFTACSSPTAPHASSVRQPGSRTDSTGYNPVGAKISADTTR